MAFKKKDIFILASLICLLIIVNYSFLDSFLEDFLIEREKVLVSRVIDGDTVVTEMGNVRLLGINSPEKGEFLYEEAKNFLEEKVLNKSVYLEFGKDKTDKYGRILAYIFLNGENVNMESVRSGFSNYYFPSGKDNYYKDFVDSWEKCIKEEKNLCELSKDSCAKCIVLKEFDSSKQKVVLYNSCSFSCNLEKWVIQNEGRKRFIFESFILNSFSSVIIEVGDYEDAGNRLYWREKNRVWTRSGDTLFLRDSSGKLVLWKTY